MATACIVRTPMAPPQRPRRAGGSVVLWVCACATCAPASSPSNDAATIDLECESTLTSAADSTAKAGRGIGDDSLESAHGGRQAALMDGVVLRGARLSAGAGASGRRLRLGRAVVPDGGRWWQRVVCLVPAATGASNSLSRLRQALAALAAPAA